jgi:hypothetical protein
VKKRRTRTRRAFDDVEAQLQKIEDEATKAWPADPRPSMLAAYGRLQTTRLRLLARLTLEEYPLRGDERWSPERLSERGRLRHLALEILAVIAPEPGDFISPASGARHPASRTPRRKRS